MLRWLAALLLAGCATAPESPIGFRVVDLYDKLRGDDPMIGRPLRVRLFYPSLPNGKAITMHEYLAEWPMSGVEAETWSATIARERDGVALETPVRGRLDASPDRTRHPLVLLVLDAPLDRVARAAEDLAAHGYVAAALPRGSDETDIRFANVELRGLADVDEHRIAVIRHFDGNLRELRREVSETFSRVSSKPSRARYP